LKYFVRDFQLLCNAREEIENGYVWEEFVLEAPLQVTSEMCDGETELQRNKRSKDVTKTSAVK
jgi:hypothetical protein